MFKNIISIKILTVTCNSWLPQYEKDFLKSFYRVWNSNIWLLQFQWGELKLPFEIFKNRNNYSNFCTIYEIIFFYLYNCYAITTIVPRCDFKRMVCLETYSDLCKKLSHFFEYKYYNHIYLFLRIHGRVVFAPFQLWFILSYRYLLFSLSI